MSKFFRHIHAQFSSSEDEVWENAFDRRQRFLQEADTSLANIPLPDGVSKAVRLAEVIPDGIRLGSITWGVKTNLGERFVFAGRWPNGDEKRWIVMAKARYFYAAWLASRDQATGTRSDPPDFQNLLIKNPWMQHSTQEVWTLNNPVHIPKIGSGFSDNKNCHIAFTNGRHRTRWLISQGAAVVPLETDTERAAHALHEMFGLSEYPPANVLQWQRARAATRSLKPS